MSKELSNIIVILREQAAYLRSKLDDVDQLEQADRVMTEIARLESLLRRP